MRRADWRAGDEISCRHRIRSLLPLTSAYLSRASQPAALPAAVPPSRLQTVRSGSRLPHRRRRNGEDSDRRREPASTRRRETEAGTARPQCRAARPRSPHAGGCSRSSRSTRGDNSARRDHELLPGLRLRHRGVAGRRRRQNGSTASPACAGTIPAPASRCLGASQGHIAARIGYGYQEHPGEFLAMLAMSRVPSTIRSASATTSAPWPTWSRPRSSVAAPAATVAEADRTGVLRRRRRSGRTTWAKPGRSSGSSSEEIAQPVVTAPEGGLNRLMGLSYAVRHRSQTRTADRRPVPTGAEIRRRLPRLRPAAAELRRQLGAVFPGCQKRQPRRGPSCGPPAACWSGWRCRCPTSGWRTPA